MINFAKPSTGNLLNFESSFGLNISMDLVMAKLPSEDNKGEYEKSRYSKVPFELNQNY